MNRPDDPSFLAALGRFGYPLLEPDVPADPNAVLARMVRSNDSRMHEGFPVVLAHALRQSESGLSWNRLQDNVPGWRRKKVLPGLLALSQALFDLYGLGLDVKSAHLPLEQEDLKTAVAWLDRGEAGLWAGVELDPQRIKSAFLHYTMAGLKTREASEKTRLREDFRREYLLSLVLSPKQKELLDKKLRGESMTKTEKEYYSRVVRKRLMALADPDLHRLAQKALQG